MMRELVTILLTVAFMVQLNIAATQEEEIMDREKYVRNETMMMESGYECQFKILSWCEALEVEWIRNKTRQTRQEFGEQIFAVLDSNEYDHQKRPDTDKDFDSLTVKITVHVESLGPASELEMSLEQDLYLTQIWTDKRLRFEMNSDNTNTSRRTRRDTSSTKKKKKIVFDYDSDYDDEEVEKEEDYSVSIHTDMIHKLWTPELYFRNSIFTQMARTHEDKMATLVKIKPNGEVTLIERFRVKSSCHMKLEYFPFDQQICELEISTFGFDDTDFSLKWGEPPISFKRPQILSEFNFIRHNVTLRQFHTKSMEEFQTELVVQYLLTRQTSFYLAQIFAPSTWIVIISWTTFYINPEAVAARTSIAITCALTMMTLTTGCIGSLPACPNYTPVSIYLSVCFLFVFAALIEFAFASFAETNYKHMQKTTDQQRNSQCILRRCDCNYPLRNFQNFPPIELRTLDHQQDHTSPTIHLPLLSIEEQSNCQKIKSNQQDRNSQISTSGRQKFWTWLGSDPVMIDIFSRFCYPISFALFNLVFWCLTLSQTKQFNDRVAETVKEVQNNL